MNHNMNFINTWSKKFGLIYTVTFTIIFAILNYYHKKISLSAPTVVILGLLLFTIVSLIAPIIVFMKYERWNAEDFGVVSNKKMVIITLIFTIPIAVILLDRSTINKQPINIISIIIRVGEELFYRGFLFQYFNIVFKNKKYSVIKTILLTSLFFALIHTQTFLSTNPNTMIHIFLYALAFATIRYYTKSILTPTVLHCISDAGIMGGVFGTLIYYLLYKSRFITHTNKDN